MSSSYYEDFSWQSAANVAEAIETLEANVAEAIDLQFLGLTSNAAAALATALAENSSCVALHLPYNNIGDDGAEALCEAITKQQRVAFLELENCGLLSRSARALGECLGQSRSLKYLSLWGNRVSREGAEGLASGLVRNESLLQLNLQSAGIEDAGAMALAAALRENQVLTKLDLEGNRISSKGALALGEVLSSASALKSLGLWNNDVGDEGAAYLAKSLEKNDTLTHLDLHNNNIGTGGARALARALKVNSHLLSLDLQRNNIGEEGAKLIAEGLKVNNALVKLILSKNNIYESGGKAIADALKLNSSMRQLFLWGNDLAKDTINGLLQLNQEFQQSAFNEALRKGRKGPWQRSKLMVIGAARAGKSSTIRSLLGKSFEANWNSTVGMSLSKTKVLPRQNSWTVMDSEDSDGFTSSFAASLAIESLSRERSAMRKSKSRLVAAGGSSGQRQTSQISKGKTMKAVVEVREDDEEEEEKVRVFDEKLFLEAKSQRGKITLSIWDFAGQRVFYTLHHVFLTEYGVYLLVFDMQLLLSSDRYVDYLRFWLNSVRMYADRAPLLLVGTFLDALDAKRDLTLVQSRLEALVKIKSCVGNKRAGLTFFPVDNKNRLGISELREHIDVAVKGQDHVRQPVSILWMKCLDKLMEMKDQSWVRFKTVKELARECRIRSSNEIKRMLRFFHQLGVLLYFTSTELLRDIVILDPQWMIDSISKAIRQPRTHEVDHALVAKVGLTKDMETLHRDGLASRDLLEFLWTKQQAEILLDLCRSLLLMSNWSFHRASDRTYLVPSMVQKRMPEEPFQARFCEFDFSPSYLPIGVFERLVCMAVNSLGTSQSSSPDLKKNYVRLATAGPDPANLILRRKKQVITMYVTREGAAKECFHAVAAMLKKLKDEILGAKLQWEVYFVNGETGVRSPIREAKRLKLRPWFENTGTTPTRLLNVDAL